MEEEHSQFSLESEMETLDLTYSAPNEIISHESHKETNQLLRVEGKDRESLKHLRQMLQSMRSPTNHEETSLDFSIKTSIKTAIETPFENHMDDNWNGANGSREEDWSAPKMEDMESAILQEVRTPLRMKEPKNGRRKHVSNSPPKIVFGRRMSTTNDYKVRQKPTYGTNAFDKRMELEEEEEWKNEMEDEKRNQRNESVFDDNSETMNIDVVRQLRALRGASDKSEHSSIIDRSQRNNNNKKKLRPSPPKNLSEVPHSDNSQVRRWKRPPFT